MDQLHHRWYVYLCAAIAWGVFAFLALTAATWLWSWDTKQAWEFAAKVIGFIPAAIASVTFCGLWIGASARFIRKVSGR